MKRLLMMALLLSGVSLAGLSGEHLVLADGDNTAFKDITPSTPWSALTVANPDDKWQDRSTGTAVAFVSYVTDPLGPVNKSYEGRDWLTTPQHGLGDIVTTISGLTAGQNYDVWVIHSISSKAGDTTWGTGGIEAAFLGDDLVNYDRNTTVNHTNTGILSHSTEWFIYEAYLGYMAADENGEIKIHLSNNQGERSVYHGLVYAEVSDQSPPSPDPMTWAQPPSASEIGISMTATTATDPSGVEYYFTCTSGGGHDSGWQTEPTYTDTNLAFDTTYTYTVKARDSYNNETAPSSPASAMPLLLILVENFDYELNDPALISHWDDGNTNSTGSSISPYLAFYMNMAFDNTQSPYYSEVEYTFAAQDWNVANGDLSFWYLGDPNADELYVRLTDGSAGSSTLRITDPAVTQSASWIEVRLRLDDFTGVDLAQTTAIALGIGPESPSGPGSAGVVGFDEIYVTAHECDPSRAHLDIDGNCVIDMGDVLVLAEHWLLQEQTVTASSANDAQLLIHYAFDETGSDTTVSDSSGNNHDAAIQSTVAGYDPAPNWQSGGIDGSGCLNFDGQFHVSVPQTAFSSIDNEITVCFWHYADTGDWPQILTPFTFATSFSGAGDSVDWAAETPQAVSTGWNHYAFVKNAAAGTMRIYENGVLMAQADNTTGSMEQIDQSPCRIGLDSDGQSDGYLGKMDDFRVYSYALSQNEIIDLALGVDAEVQQPLVPLEISADPNPDGRIDLRDFAFIAAEWLSEL